MANTPALGGALESPASALMGGRPPRYVVDAAKRIINRTQPEIDAHDASLLAEWVLEQHIEPPKAV